MSGLLIAGDVYIDRLTAALPAGTSRHDRAGLASWRMDITWSDGRVQQLYYGAARVVA